MASVSKVDKKTARQLAAANEVMDKYDLALQALATTPDDKLKRQMEVRKRADEEVRDRLS